MNFTKIKNYSKKGEENYQKTNFEFFFFLNVKILSLKKSP